MALGVMICAWLPRATWRLRTQYLLSYITMWIGVGSVLAFLLPSARALLSTPISSALRPNSRR